MLVAVVVTSGSCGAFPDSPDRNACIEKVIPKAQVVRFDRKESRAFLASLELTPEQLAQRIPEIAPCMSDLRNDWALSLFLDPKYAGYKDEPAITELHEGDGWAKAYVAEYLHAEKELTAWPATAPKLVPVP